MLISLSDSTQPQTTDLTIRMPWNALVEVYNEMVQTQVWFYISPINSLSNKIYNQINSRYNTQTNNMWILNQKYIVFSTVVSCDCVSFVVFIWHTFTEHEYDS